MSELINNSLQRKEMLKHLILQLHQGEAPQAVRNRLIDLLSKIPYDDVVEVEQELINEGLPAEEVLKFCDIHTMVLEGHIDQSGASPVPPGHPVDTFKRENRELLDLKEKIDEMLSKAGTIPGESIKAYLLSLRAAFNLMMDVDKHYRRKEYLLFPFLEKYGVTGPPTVMWGKHDATRSMLRDSLEALSTAEGSTPAELEQLARTRLRPVLEAIADMVMKEEEILLPMCMDKLKEEDWYEIYQQSVEIGFCLFDPVTDWLPSGMAADVPEAGVKGSIRLPSGSFTLPELLSVFNTLPVDLTFIDKDDKVRFFTQGAHRIFDRNRAILGRDVRMCHPPSSVGVVEQILQDFKSGREKSAPFWINVKGRFIYIEYFAVRDPEGNYLGTLEFSQDLTDLKKLEGEQRLLSYSKPA